MKRGDENSPSDWYSIARKDIVRAKRSLDVSDTEDALFHCEQAAEKALKGHLLSLGWKLAKTHDVGALLKELNLRGVNATWFAPVAALLANEYMALRYPGFDTDPMPDLAETTRIFDETEKLLSIILPII